MPQVRLNSFKGNRSNTGGGAIYVQRGSRAIIDRNNIVSNWTGGVGGGIVVHEDNGSQITDNYIDGNRADQNGAGIYLSSTSAQVTGNQINHNTAWQLGGGIVVINGSPRLNRNLITGNSAPQAGAGVYLANSHSELVNNTLSNNGRHANGDGLYLSGGGSPSLKYNVIVSNDFGIRSSGGQPSQVMRNNVFNNRQENYLGVVAGQDDISVDPRWVNGPLGPYYLSEFGLRPVQHQPVGGCLLQQRDLNEVSTGARPAPMAGRIATPATWASTTRCHPADPSSCPLCG